MAIEQDILLTVDAVIFNQPDAESREILLVRRRNEPFKGQWVLPGGFVEDDEDLPVAAARELEEETQITVSVEDLIQVGAYGKPGRDPRGRMVTVAYVAEINQDEQKAVGSDDAEKAQWWPLNDLPQLGFDHAEILEKALKLKGIK
ncbi:NUDIX hydrolase [Fulvivirga maritima]|uniref:NUDIX domain-containing protein n=1 Tax=Fulvivirga maritima TaxID=2904247 RepID=UPI001F1D49A6|nr:NUDIX hydrolase [Fulvivirga maritima]UII26544.1 NUDIX hydrolase [Fulvivirga maritima]